MGAKQHYIHDTNDTNDKALQEAGKLLDPILNVFGGEDGGIDYYKMHHTFVPRLLAEDSEASREILAIIRSFSKLCAGINDGTIRC